MRDFYKTTLAAAAVAAAEAHRNVRRTAAGGGQASLVQFSFFLNLQHANQTYQS